MKERCTICGFSTEFLAHAPNLCLSCGDSIMSNPDALKAVADLVEQLREQVDAAKADSHKWQTDNPPVAGYYLTTDRFGYVTDLYWDEVWFDERWPLPDGFIIAWMDKPEPYKETS